MAADFRVSPAPGGRPRAAGRSPGLGLLLGGTLAVAAAYGGAFLPGGAPAWAPWSMAAGVTAFCAGTLRLGAARGRRPGLAAAAIGAAAGVVLLAFGLALLLPADEAPGAALWLGLPRRAALVLYGAGLLPALVLPLAYALTFDGSPFRPDAVERLRAAGPPRGDGTP